MNRKQLHGIILAGGMGKRMQSSIPKVLHKVDDVPMLVRLINEMNKLNPDKIIIVVGQSQKIIDETVRRYIDFNKINIVYALQKEPLGTGHAVLCTLDLLEDNAITLIVNGDNPLLTSDLMQNAINYSIDYNNELQITAIDAEKPMGSGRIIIKDNIFEKIVEEKDCNEEEKKITLVNRGIYVILSDVLKKYIPLIKNNNAQKEYYLTDIVEICKDSVKIGIYRVDRSKESELININTKEQLDKLNKKFDKIIQ
jgi:bifunctional N-acetylglucosamine-1-phosphate-uridyltransferase/glucosamine-1-phosphate-acetyltransferase GlmU-like protein